MDSFPPESEDGKLIASELKGALSAPELAEFSLPPRWIASAKAGNHKGGQEMILKLANEVAIKHRQSVSYSNFHTWEHFQQFQTGKEASEAPPPSSSQSFQNCLYMANSCAEALRAALLKQGKEYAPLADRVQIATDCWNQNHTSSRQNHCLVMLRLPDVWRRMS
jgi:hypothetical protein